MKFASHPKGVGPDPQDPHPLDPPLNYCKEGIGQTNDEVLILRLCCISQMTKRAHFSIHVDVLSVVIFQKRDILSKTIVPS